MGIGTRGPTKGYCGPLEELPPRAAKLSSVLPARPESPATVMCKDTFASQGSSSDLLSPGWRGRRAVPDSSQTGDRLDPGL
ncbi:unnamed protein product [Boreogadus saida]